MKNKFEQFIEATIKVEKNMIKNGGDFYPVLHSFWTCKKCQDYRIAHVMILADMDLIRERFKLFIKSLQMNKMLCDKCQSYSMELYGYVFSSTGWMVKSKTPINCPPSEHPDRKEVYFVVYSTVDGDKGIRLFIIDRDNDEIKFLQREMSKMSWLDSKFIVDISAPRYFG